MLEKLRASIKALGLSGTPSLASIRTKYLQLARLHHPDIHGGDSQRMARFNQAYEFLQLNAHMLENHQANHPTRTAPKAPKQGGCDWVIDLRLSPQEKTNPDGHPLAKTSRFSFMDDLSLYRAILVGNNPRQIARSFGCTEKEVIARVQTVQFKRRVRFAKSSHHGNTRKR